MSNIKLKCQGKRLQFLGTEYGVFKCQKKAIGVLNTQLGFSEYHYVCNNDECYNFLTKGYPATFTKIK